MKLTIATLLLLAAPARADDTDASWRLSVETDPSAFVLGGFSGWVNAKPAGTRHLRVGAGAFGLEFPSFIVPTLNGTSEDGWDLEVRAAMGFAAYQLGDRKGLYIGAYAGYLQSLHTRSDTMGSARRDNLSVLPAIGYQWFPFRTGALKGAYVEPWAGATIWIPVGGTTTLGTHTFKDPHVIPIAAVHLGFEL